MQLDHGADKKLQDREFITTLTGLRGLAALWVVVYHFRHPILSISFLKPATGIVIFGILAVDIFFVMSGFLLYHTYRDRVTDRTSYLHFLGARFARIYPLHIATLAVIATLVGIAIATSTYLPENNYSATNLFGNIAMLQIFTHPWNGVTWTLSAEFFMYFMFPIIILSIKKVSTPAVLVAIAITLSTAGGAAMGILYSNHTLAMDSGMGALIRVAIEFPLGCILYRIWQSQRFARWWSLTSVLSLLIIVGMLVIFSDYSEPTNDPAAGNTGIPILGFSLLPVITLFVVSCAHPHGIVAILLNSWPAQQLGRVSFSLYITHLIVLGPIQYIFHLESKIASMPLPVRTLAIFSCLALSLGVAHYSWQFIEEPARKHLNRWIKNRIPRPADQPEYQPIPGPRTPPHEGIAKP